LSVLALRLVDWDYYKKCIVSILNKKVVSSENEDGKNFIELEYEFESFRC